MVGRWSTGGLGGRRAARLSALCGIALALSGCVDPADAGDEEASGDNGAASGSGNGNSGPVRGFDVGSAPWPEAGAQPPPPSPRFDLAPPPGPPSDASTAPLPAEDAGPVGPMPDAEVFDPNRVTLQGTVSRLTAQDPSTRITARCGDTVRAEAEILEDFAEYSLDVDVTDCTELVVSFDNLGSVPAHRVIPMPPPTARLTLDIEMGTVEAVQCEDGCTTAAGLISTFPADPIRQGYVSVQPHDATHLVPGGFQQNTGELIRLNGFAYMDFRDAGQNPIQEFPSTYECFLVDRRSWAVTVDVRPETPEVENVLFSYDEAAARWVRRGFARLSRRLEMEGTEAYTPITRDDLAALRSGDAMDTFWMCAPITGSGWVGWGAVRSGRTCVQFSATDQCGTPQRGVHFELEGAAGSFRAEGWTGSDGLGCAVVPASEPDGEDYDADEVPGQAAALNVFARHPDGPVSSSEDLAPPPTQPNVQPSCDASEDCFPIEGTFELFGACN